MNRYKSLAIFSLTMLVLGACGTMDNGGIFGGGGQNNYDIRGTVDHVDLNSHSIYLTNVSGYNTMLSGGGGNSVRLYYDDRTTVSYGGQTYRPQDLERGDEISARVDESSNQLFAQSVTVTRDVSSGGTSYPSDSSNYLSTIRGTVRSINTSSRTIELESTSWISGFNTGGTTGSRMLFQYSSNTGIDVNGQIHPVENLERGDVVDIQFRNSTSTTPFADRITLVRDVRR